MPLLRLHDCPARPWKNGLGRTRELAVEPPGADMDTFLWRVSVAEVDSAAPFSAFPGIDRTIVLLDGDGFTMTMDDGSAHALTEPFAPFAFAGEAQVSVALAGGPTRDFNLMVRRGLARGRVVVCRGTAAFESGAHTVLLFCARGRMHLGGDVLEAGDAWLGPAPTRTVPRPDTVALAIEVTPVA